MAFELQPCLENEVVRLQPVAPGDFDALYAVAADPRIWEQHPSRERYQRPVFQTYFDGALLSGGAFCIFDQTTQALIGSSRYYNLDESNRQVSIGYTFLARCVWGGGHNRALKKLMLDHAFRFVDRVKFEVGAANLRSRKAMDKLGGKLQGEALVSYHGEAATPNVIYVIDGRDWPACA